MLDESSLGLALLIVKEIFHSLRTTTHQRRIHFIGRTKRHAALQVADYGYVLETGEISLEGDSKSFAHNHKGEIFRSF